MRAWTAIQLTLLLMCSSLISCAQKPPGAQREARLAYRPVLKLACPRDSTYVFWVESVSKTPRTLVFPTEFKGATHKVDLTSVLDEAPEKAISVTVLDTKSGNMCRQEAEVKPPDISLALTADEFDLIGELVVSGNGLKAGYVTIKDSKGREFGRTILPADAGRATFVGVAMGKIEAELAYGSEKMSVTKNIGKARKNPVVTVAFTIPGAEPEKAAGKKEHGPAAAKKEPTRSPTSSILNMFLALVIVALVIWIIAGYVRRKGITVDQALGKLGVDVSQGAGPPSAAPEEGVKVPEGTCPYCGKPLDPTTGTCPACSVAPAALGPIASGAAKLVGSAGAALGQIFGLGDAKVTIGREPGNTIALTQDTTVSRRHAEIEKRGDGFVIRDLGSSNGTFVNGARITEQTLNPGDEVQLGSSRFRFEVS
jgi:hypothetical protein